MRDIVLMLQDTCLRLDFSSACSTYYGYLTRSSNCYRLSCVGLRVSALRFEKAYKETRLHACYVLFVLL